MPEGERLITEKNEWGDYKVKGLQIRQLEKAKAIEELNKSVSGGWLSLEELAVFLEWFGCTNLKI